MSDEEQCTRSPRLDRTPCAILKTQASDKKLGIWLWCAPCLRAEVRWLRALIADLQDDQTCKEGGE